jgi:hypothetical protein
VIAGRRPDRGEKLPGELGDAASFIRADVSVEADVKAMIDNAVDRYDRLDCLVNDAGRSSQYAAIADVDLEQFDAFRSWRSVRKSRRFYHEGKHAAPSQKIHCVLTCFLHNWLSGRSPKSTAILAA